MSKHKKPIDKLFLGIVITLVVVGILVFVSASLGILAKDVSKFYNVLFNQLVLGVCLGGIALFFATKINYRFLRKYAFYIFLFCLFLMTLVFIPGVGYEHGGAKRWIDVFGIFSFQPAELLKLGFIIYFAGWLSWVKHRVTDLRFGVLPFAILLAITAGLLFLQPDTKSFILMLGTGLVMLFISGIPWKYLLGIAGTGFACLLILALTTPYLTSRIKTFVDPEHDPRGASYQLQQSLLAIGSGGLVGRGYGQSVQKFSYLPEPQGDSVFAVVGEEFGFIGSVILIILYIGFMLRGYRIANRTTDLFGRLLVVGIVTLIILQTIMNMTSITGIAPLTGVPLPFVSHGGTSLLITLMSIGIVLSISRNEKSA